MAGQNTGYDFRMSSLRPSCGEEVTPDEIKEALSKVCKKWVFQREKTNDGYDHYNGRCQTIKKAIKKTVLDLFVKAFNFPISDVFQYFEPTVKGVHSTNSFNYVMKEDTRIDGPWTDKDYVPEKLREKPYIPDYLRKLKKDDFYPFQKTIIEWSEECCNDRTVRVLLDTKGNLGKSTIMHYVRIHGGMMLPFVSDAKDLVAAACDIAMSRNLRQVKGIFIDIPRAKQLTSEFCVAVEIMKKGWLYDLRHRFKEWQIDAPPIIITCNTLPPLEYLSKDMWKIYEINDNKEVVEYVPPDPEIEVDAVIYKERIIPIEEKRYKIVKNKFKK